MSPEPLDHFGVCCTCAGLAGYPEGREEYPQVCACVEADRPRWPDHDFNAYLSLCWCCLLEVIPSGSKWSQFYCRDCRHLARRYNESAGRIMFLMGRHSFMNGIGLSGREAARPEALQAFASALKNLFLGMQGFVEAVDRWQPTRLQVVLEAAGRGVPPSSEPQKLPLAGYLQAAEGLAGHQRFGKRAAFDALCSFLGFPSLPEAT